MSPVPPRADMPDVAPTVQQDVARLAASPEVRSAYNWLRMQEPQLAQWQMEMARIPAPPFGESAMWATYLGCILDSGSGMSR
jgi:tripeptide aminopeptidase